MSDSDEQTADEQDTQALRLAFMRVLVYLEAETRKPVQDAYLRHANATQAYLTLSSTWRQRRGNRCRTPI